MSYEVEPSLINYIDMPLQRLDERGKVLTESLNTIRHHPERVAQIKKELGDIAFEMWFRYQEGEFDIIKLNGGSDARTQD